jgi:hypothetical protein
MSFVVRKLRVGAYNTPHTLQIDVCCSLTLDCFMIFCEIFVGSGQNGRCLRKIMDIAHKRQSCHAQP